MFGFVSSCSAAAFMLLFLQRGSARAVFGFASSCSSAVPGTRLVWHPCTCFLLFFSFVYFFYTCHGAEEEEASILCTECCTNSLYSMSFKFLVELLP